MHDDFKLVEHEFSQPNPRKNLLAATKLRNLGASGYVFLPSVFRMCREIDLHSEIDKRDYRFLLGAVRSIGCVINATGYDSSVDLHHEFVEWTLRLTDHSDNELCAVGTWALGDLGTPPESSRSRLIELVRSTRRKNDHELTTCRSIAFRMLARVDRDSASQFTETVACKEYIASMDHWLHQNANRPKGNYDSGPELQAEVAWLRDKEDR